MKSTSLSQTLSQFLFLAAAVQTTFAIQAPGGLVTRAGDQSVILHWDPNSDANSGGYRVYRSTNSAGPFALQNSSLLSSPGFCDLNLVSKNGQTYFYNVTAVTTSSQESTPSTNVSAVPHLFVSDDEFLDYVQSANFDYFWYTANPNNGL